MPQAFGVPNKGATHAELSKSEDHNEVDTLGWSYLFNNEASNAVGTWKSIPEKERPFVSDIGIWIAELDKTTDEEFGKQWKEISAHLISQPRTNLFVYLLLADKWAAAGNPERARQIYEGLTQFGAWSYAIPEIETKCPTCRTAFEERFGHQVCLWSIPVAGKKPSATDKPAEEPPTTSAPAAANE